MSAAASEPTFTQAGATALYWLDPAVPITGFLATTALGTSPTLSATWADIGGIYLILGQPAGASFLDELQAYLASFRPGAAPLILWILDPGQAYLSWTIRELYVAPGSTAGTWVVAQSLDIGFADNTLIVSGGGVIGPTQIGDAGWGFGIADVGSTPALTFFTADGQFGSAPNTALFSMAGPSAGCWRARFDLPAPSAGVDAFAQLDCAIRYFIARPVSGEIHAIDFAVFTQPSATAFSLYVNLDGLRPLNGDRSNLGFFTWAKAGTAPTLQSGYATARGYGVNLTPLASSLPPARLVFAVAPFYAGGEDSPSGYYLTPDGGFALVVIQPVAEADAAAAIDRLVCGASALEYLGLPVAGNAVLHFLPGQPAYAQRATVNKPATLTALGTTAWAYPSAPTGIIYYAQPEDAPYFTAVGADAPADLPAEGAGATAFLNFLEIPATTLAAAAAGLAFPMAPFRNLAADMLTDALMIEQIALAPRRRAILAGMAQAEAGVGAASAQAATIGVTPQGLAVGIAADAQTWVWSALGQTAVQGAVPELRFTSVKGALKQALLTNNLFMVLGDASKFGTAGSVAYQLSALDLDVIATLPLDDGVPPAVLADVRSYMSAQNYPMYNDLTAFQAALVAAHAGITASQMLVFQRFAGQLSPLVDGWTFRMSPDNWTLPGRSGQTNAYIIYKFNLGRSLADMAADVSTWTWPEAAHPGNDPSTASGDILGILKTAADRQAEGSSLYAAFNGLVADPNWTGILALSVVVPLDQLPGPLQPLAAGIDSKAFYAHHIGIAATPYQLAAGAITFQRSTLFGLIDYENPEDQYFSEDIAFAFRVLQLSVGFQNSVVTTFASRVELMINRLFGAPSRLFPSVHGNNIILTGAHQVQTLPDGTEHDTYVFAMTGENNFNLNGLILQSVELISTDMVTAQVASPSGSAKVTATFRMSGNLRFYEPDLFDPFCWGQGLALDGTATDGYLRFGNLSVDMSFDLGAPDTTTTFKLNDGALSFDLSNSVARPNALVRRFPVRLANLISTPDPKLTTTDTTAITPGGMGFVSVSAPIDQGLLSQPWYGLNYTIDLGTLGALAGSVGISLSVLAAWSPGPDGLAPNIYVGVKLPGTKEAFGVSLPLQGILKLGFRSIEFLVDNESGQPRTYTLRLRDFALRLLGLAFPPGHNDVVLFGNPDQTSGDKVGWYAAYSQESDPKAADMASRRSLRQSRAFSRSSGVES